MNIDIKYPFFHAGFASAECLGQNVRVSSAAFGRVSRIVHEGNSVQLFLVDMNQSGARELFILTPGTVLEVVRSDGTSYAVPSVRELAEDKSGEDD